MKMYAIKFSQTAEKQFEKLDISIQERVIASLERIRFRPYHFVKRIVGTDSYRLRVGDYRVILNIQNDVLVIMVITIGHRKIIYKDLKIK